MLGRTLHVKRRCFTYIPNPTIYRWSKQSFSFHSLLVGFCNELEELHDLSTSTDLRYIFKVAVGVKDAANTENFLGPRHLDILHAAISRADDILYKEHDSKFVVLDVIRRHLKALASDHDKSFAGVGDLPAVYMGPVELQETRFMRAYFSHILPQVQSIKDSGRVDTDQGRRSLIWCTLIFRMLCWLLLHDFAYEDVQVPKADVIACQLAVYIE